MDTKNYSSNGAPKFNTFTSITYKRKLWVVNDGLLMLYGSYLSGEARFNRLGQLEHSDLDFLWIGSSLRPNNEYLQDLIPKLLPTLNNQSNPVRIGTKSIISEFMLSYPAWMTNVWLPAMEHHLQQEPSFGRLISKNLLEFRSLSGQDVNEAVDYAWRYVILFTDPHNMSASEFDYMVAKLLLVLLRIRVQISGLALLRYADMLKYTGNFESDCSRIFSLAWQVKTGLHSILDFNTRIEMCSTARKITYDILSHSYQENIESTLVLIEAVYNWADCCNQQQTGDDLSVSYPRSIISYGLLERSKNLPSFDREKKILYKEAASRWLQKEH